MAELAHTITHDSSESKFKKSFKTFTYTWKISNFRDILNEDYPFLSNSGGSEKAASWDVKLYFSEHPSYKQKVYGWEYWRTCIPVEVNVNNCLTQSSPYDYYNLKVSIINKNNTAIVQHNSTKQKLSPYSCQSCFERYALLQENSSLLQGNDLVLKFDLTITTCKFFFTNFSTIKLPKMSIHSHLEAMINNEKFSDVKITIGDKIFYAHKVILAARSPVFATMFEHNMKENIENIVEIDDVEENIMQELLYFIYTGKVNDVENVAQDLLVAADKYAIEGLKLLCEEVLVKQLQVENVIALLIHAEKYRANLLKESALQYFNLHLKEIVKTEVFEKELNSFVHLVPDLFKSLTL